MKLRVLLCIMLLVRPAVANAQDTTRRASASISGVVHDSIAQRPLAGALVQLVVVDGVTDFARTAVSDSVGRFTLGELPAGRYTLGFFHPLLDSLGVDAPLREVNVDGYRSVRADLAIPSPARLRAVICGPGSTRDSGAVLIGVVRDAHKDAPAAGVTVTGEWLELTFGRDGFVRRVPRLVATTGENGWFAMCNVPSGGTIALVASRGPDSTDLIEVQIPTLGFLRREMYLGSTRTVVITDTTKRSDTVALRSRRVHTGDGRLSGTAVSAEGSKPLPGAQVSITNGPQTRANERGEWTLADAPSGTRMLEVRAVGYYPERRPVNVIVGAAPIKVALSTLKAVLDTVRITASRLTNFQLSGFAERRRSSGAGRYLAAEDVMRHAPVVASDIFRVVPGIRIDRRSDGPSQIVMRGTFEEQCTPAVYLDGHYMREFTADDIDGLIIPDEIAGVEIYSVGTAPPQFQPGLSGCGSLVIWTQPRTASPKRDR